MIDALCGLVYRMLSKVVKDFFDREDRTSVSSNIMFRLIAG